MCVSGDYKRDEVQSELNALKYTGDNGVEKDAFLFGTITTITGKG